MLAMAVAFHLTCGHYPVDPELAERLLPVCCDAVQAARRHDSHATVALHEDNSPISAQEVIDTFGLHHLIEEE